MCSSFNFPLSIHYCKLSKYFLVSISCCALVVNLNFFIRFCARIIHFLPPQGVPHCALMNEPPPTHPAHLVLSNIFTTFIRLLLFFFISSGARRCAFIIPLPPALPPQLALPLQTHQQHKVYRVADFLIFI